MTKAERKQSRDTNQTSPAILELLDELDAQDDKIKHMIIEHKAELEKVGKEVSEERILKRQVLDKVADYWIERNEHVVLLEAANKRVEELKASYAMTTMAEAALKTAIAHTLQSFEQSEQSEQVDIHKLNLRYMTDAVFHAKVEALHNACMMVLREHGTVA